MNYELGVQKGPACDASDFTKMKRQAIIVSGAVKGGRKGTGTVIDGPHTRGFSGGIVELQAKGGYLNFLSYQ